MLLVASHFESHVVSCTNLQVVASSDNACVNVVVQMAVVAS